jgi:hypothetical protein
MMKIELTCGRPPPQRKKELSADETIYAFRLDTMYKKDEQEMQSSVMINIYSRQEQIKTAYQT